MQILAATGRGTPCCQRLRANPGARLNRALTLSLPALRCAAACAFGFRDHFVCAVVSIACRKPRGYALQGLKFVDPPVCRQGLRYCALQQPRAKLYSVLAGLAQRSHVLQCRMPTETPHAHLVLLTYVLHLFAVCRQLCVLSRSVPRWSALWPRQLCQVRMMRSSYWSHPSWHYKNAERCFCVIISPCVVWQHWRLA